MEVEEHQTEGSEGSMGVLTNPNFQVLLLENVAVLESRWVEVLEIPMCLWRAAVHVPPKHHSIWKQMCLYWNMGWNLGSLPVSLGEPPLRILSGVWGLCAPGAQ